MLTREYGILSFVGKAAKKLSSKNHFFPLCLYEFIIDYKDGHTMYTIHGNKLLNDYWSDSPFDLLNFKNILLELTLKNSEIPAYDELLFVLDHIDDRNKYLLGSIYVSYLMKEFGVTPMVDHCVVCGNPKVVAISNRHGGFLCQNHLQGEESRPVERLKRFRLLARADRSKYDLIKEIDHGGEYITHDSTLFHLEDGWQPTLSDWNRYEGWMKTEPREIEERAGIRVKEIIENARPLLDPSTIKSLKKYIESFE